MPAIFFHNPCELKRAYRLGSEEEYYIRRFFFSSFICKKKQNKKSQIGNYSKNILIKEIHCLPKISLKNFEFDGYKYLIQNFHLMSLFTLKNIVEIDSEFELKPQPLNIYEDFNDFELTEISNFAETENPFNVSGYFNLSSMRNIKIDMQYYFKKRIDLPSGIKNKFLLYFLQK